MRCPQALHTPNVPSLIRVNASSIARRSRPSVWCNRIRSSASKSALAWSTRSPCQPPAPGTRVSAPLLLVADNSSRLASSNRSYLRKPVTPLAEAPIFLPRPLTPPPHSTVACSLRSLKLGGLSAAHLSMYGNSPTGGCAPSRLARLRPLTRPSSPQRTTQPVTTLGDDSSWRNGL
jgi:hypothetical protein